MILSPMLVQTSNLKPSVYWIPKVKVAYGMTRNAIVILDVNP